MNVFKILNKTKITLVPIILYPIDCRAFTLEISRDKIIYMPTLIYGWMNAFDGNIHLVGGRCLN
jgi:hypothetical protein